MTHLVIFFILMILGHKLKMYHGYKSKMIGDLPMLLSILVSAYDEQRSFTTYLCLIFY